MRIYQPRPEWNVSIELIEARLTEIRIEIPGEPQVLIAHIPPPKAETLSSVAWASVQNKPGFFPPELHTQPASSIEGLEAAIEAETDIPNLTLWFENQLV